MVLQFYKPKQFAKFGNFLGILMQFAVFMLFCVVFKHTGGVFLCSFAVFIHPLHCTPPSFSLAFYQGHINQVNMVCHTYNHKKKLEELFTLSSELPFLADLVFWLYYIVMQFALLFLIIKIPKYVTQCSPSLEENHIDKN